MKNAVPDLARSSRGHDAPGHPLSFLASRDQSLKGELQLRCNCTTGQRPGKDRQAAPAQTCAAASRAIRPRMPLTKRPESAVEYCLARSTASLIVTAAGTSR